jgi:hypothetical protein
MRWALIAAIVMAAEAAHADPCAAPDPIDAAPRAMAVALGPPPDSAAGWTRTLAAADGSQFPAVSEDGRVIVELFYDRNAGQPLGTVVFFSRSRRAATIDLASDTTDSRAQERLERRALAAINERLGRARWRPLAVATPCDALLHDAVTAALGDGVTVTVAGRSISITRDGANRPTHATIPDLARTCDRFAVLDRAFGSRAIGFAVVVPHVDVPDVSCVGSPTAALAVAVPIP